jgi:peptidoglycan/xylan/chitin deacetylase (PgdA/CDA1 family)
VTVVLYYHELSDVRSPLAVSPKLFSEHMTVLSECRAEVLTAGELVEALDAGPLPPRTVVITFDDCFAAAVCEAHAILGAAGFRATFYAVAGHLGGDNRWPTQPAGAPVAPLASADDLAALAADGHEIGSHGWTHAPLDRPADLTREIVDSRKSLAAATRAEIRTFAYPYGARPTAAAHALVAATYTGAFATTIGRINTGSPRWRLPRVDAHYLRDPRLLRRVVTGSLDAYLSARRFGSRGRRVFFKDYVPLSSGDGG